MKVKPDTQKARLVKNLSVYKHRFYEAVKHLCSLGLTEAEVGEVTGTTYKSFRTTKKNDPKVQQAIDEGREKLHKMLFAQMVMAATGYEYTEEEYVSKWDEELKRWRPASKKKHKKRQKPDGYLFTFLMTNRWPQHWKLSQELINKREQTYDKEPGEHDRKKVESQARKLLGDDTLRPAGEHSVSG